MSVISSETQSRIEQQLVTDGLINNEVLAELKEESKTSKTPFLTLLAEKGEVPSESITRTVAKVNGIPYVNLSNALIDADVLDLLPEDVAERFMAVPLGEMQNRLAVAMLDADNVQAMDFLSSSIG